MTIQIPGDLPVDQDASGDDGALRGDRLGARAGLSSSPLQVGGDFVFIDSRVPDIQDLVNGVKPGERVFVISSDQDGLTQIANILAANHAQNLASISIVSHGSVGEIEIGSTILNDGTLSAHADALSAIGATLQPGGDVQLFSCNTAQGAVGAQFIGDLSTLLGGADVAASTHNVGSASAGGSFLLDSATGTIDAVSPFTGQATGSFDGTLAGTISGQAWYGANGGGTRSIVGHINSDGSSPTQQGDESGVGEVQAKSVGIDLAAGFYFQTDDTTNRTISSYDYVTGNVISTVQIGDLAGAGTGDDDIVNALAVDPLHNTIYVGKWGQTSALSGIIKLTYNTSTGVLDPNAAYNASPLFIVHSNSGIDDIRGVAVDPINQVVYFTTNNSTLNTGGFSYTNALWRVNSDGSSLTQMTTGAQFPAVAQASQQNALGAVVYDAAKGLVYFETHEQGVVNTTKLWYISSSATGGTATQVSLPGGTVLATGDTPQAGLTLDAQNQQLYIVVQSGTGVAATDQMLVGQLSADGHSITSIVQTYSYATLDGQSHTANEHITGATFDLLPVLAITGTTTHAVEQSASIVLPASESSTDADSNHYAGATVQITGGTFSSNESSANDDHLTINGAITGTVAGTSITLSYVAATETLTLSGYDTVAHYDAALALVKYNTTGDNPTNYGSNTTRTITWTLDDGALNIPSGQQNSGTTTLTVDGVNDATTLANGATISYTEQAAAATIDSAITVSDPDNLNEGSATVVISAGFQTGDTLSANVSGTSITITSFNAGGNHTLILTGSDTLAHYQQVLRTVTFQNSTNDDPTAGGTATSRTIQYQTDDGTADPLHLSNTISATVNITAVNDAPAAVAPGTHYAATEQTSLSLKNTGISVSDVDGSSGSETLTLSVGEGTLNATAGTSGAGVSGSGTGTLTITGTIAQLNAFLNTDGTSTFTYIDNTDTPSASTTLSVSINDNGNTGTGGSQIGSASSTIDITAVNDAPVPNVPGVDYTATEQVVLSLKNTGLSITDDGGAGSETVTISVGEGTLTATAGTSGAGISGNGTGTLTITGTVAQINDLLNTNGTSTIAYIDNTDTPSASTTLSVHVDDNGNSGTGGALTGDASVTIDITAVNDAPTALMTTDPYAAIEQTTLNLKGTGMSVGDVDSLGASERITLSVGEGTLTVTVGDSGVSIFSGNGTSSVVIDGTIAQLNALLGAGGTSTLTYIDNTDSPSASTTLTLQVNDQGNTGTGGAQTGTDTSTINITAVNDAPSGADNTVTTLEDTAYVFAAADFGFSDATDGGANALLAVEITTLPAAGTLTDNGVAVTAGQFVSVADINSGLLVFTPASNLNGAGYASFTFQVQDNGGTANGGVDTDPTPKTMTVDVTSVNDAPAGANNTVTTLEDTGYTFAAADFGFSDPNDSPANTLLAVEITTLPAAGTLTDNGVAVVAGQFVSVADITSGKLVFTPAANANGSGYASFTFQVQDNGGTAVGGVDTDPTPRTMTIDVTAVNDAPVVANAGSTVAYTEGNAPVTLESALTISDVDSANLVGATISLSGFFAGDELKISNNTSGTIVNGGNTITYSYNAGTGTLTLSGSDTVADYQAALRLVTYDSTSLNPTNYGALPSRDVGWTVDDGSASNNNSTPVDTTINITAVDSPAVAKDDNLTTDEYTAIGAGLNLFNDNGHGVDFDPDNTSISIASVTGGPGANVGTQFMLNSGALLTVHTDGTFSYDPNHAFDSLHLAAPGSGAANTTATDTFSYTLAGGGSATVTLTIDGVDDANTIYQGTPGNDTITGSPTVGSVYHLEQGGDDTVTGGSGNDGFYFGAAFNGNDSVHGGAGGNDQLGLEGDYSGGVTLDGSKVDGVEVLAMLPGFNYNITTLDNFVPAGQTFTFWSVSMGPANHVTLDGSAELDGKFNFYLGQGNDIAKGGAGADVLYGDGGADTLTGGGGADIFGYLQVSDSHGNANGTAYDRITDFAAGTDHFRLAGLSVSAVDGIVNGSLSSASFETDLTNSFGPAVPHELAAAHAVIFHVTGGGLSGHDFLIVNAHGAAGYSAGNDYVVDVTGYTGTVATSDFI